MAYDGEIGDTPHLRRLSDALLPRSGKVLPKTVNTDDWIPVIPYDLLSKNSECIYITHRTINLAGTSGAVYHLGATDLGSGFDTPLPGPWIYKIHSIEHRVSFGTAPPIASNLDIFYQLTTVPSNSNLVDLSLSRQGDSGGKQLNNNQTFYTWQIPNYQYVNTATGTLLASEMVLPSLPVQEINTLGATLRCQIFYLDSAGAALTFPASTTFTYSAYLTRVPLADLKIDFDLQLV